MTDDLERVVHCSFDQFTTLCGSGTVDRSAVYHVFNPDNGETLVISDPGRFAAEPSLAGRGSTRAERRRRKFGRI